MEKNKTRNDEIIGEHAERCTLADFLPRDYKPRESPNYATLTEVRTGQKITVHKSMLTPQRGDLHYRVA